MDSSVCERHRLGCASQRHPELRPEVVAALIARLEPVLDPADAAGLRALLDAGDHAAAYARLDAITDDPSRTFDTADLVELVLLGQAIRPA